MIFCHTGSGKDSIRNALPLFLCLTAVNSWGGKEFNAYVQKNKARLTRDFSAEAALKVDEATELLSPSTKDTADLNAFFWELRIKLSDKKQFGADHKVRSKVLTELYLKCYEVCSDSELINGVSGDFRDNVSKRDLTGFKSAYFAIIEKRSALAHALKNDVFFLKLTKSEKAKALPKFSDPVQRAFLGDTALQTMLADDISKHIEEIRKAKATDEDLLLRSIRGALASGNTTHIGKALSPLNDTAYVFAGDGATKIHYKLFLLRALLSLNPDDVPLATIYGDKFHTACPDRMRAPDLRRRVLAHIASFNTELARRFKFSVNEPYVEKPFIESPTCLESVEQPSKGAPKSLPPKVKGKAE